jgi:hypothetical protein
MVAQTSEQCKVTVQDGQAHASMCPDMLPSLDADADMQQQLQQPSLCLLPPTSVLSMLKTAVGALPMLLIWLQAHYYCPSILRYLV